ncbi:TetR/AcrR family transcriptional regulator [Streptomyces pinistramenti]|uniref:TetR/AcrR family transcriptional regulator n=1 Tax=Streptomyces pinistramenti TaxID=2884812 RepID=UPI001D069DD4|nr:TetR/AcrR family transcriptional regulator [Streptomyces pinistramenti]MCB5910056.1 TetR/AcrR family transcriptional regulator [Streptomyces pinistramenti]
MTGTGARSARISATRELLLSAAERLFAEHGVAAVSNRRVSEAAGQGNNAAVGYHFGSKGELIRAIVRKHNERIEQMRAEMVERACGSTDVRDWVACMVDPFVHHIAGLGVPSWFGRFYAQIGTDPVYREIMTDESLHSPSLVRTVEGLNNCLSGLPLEVRVERGDMMRHLVVLVVAERERALAESGPTARTSWQQTATGLSDAVAGLWLAAVSQHP